ncbi:hypothetical protein D3C78_612540 [compost metagenome]
MVARIDFAFQAAHVQGVGEVVDEAGQCFVHVAPALHRAGQAVADFTTAGYIVDVEQLDHTDQFAVVTAVHAKLELVAIGIGFAVGGQGAFGFGQVLPRCMVPIAHDLGVGHDRQPLRGIGMAHGAQLQTRAVEAEVTGETAGWGHAGSPVHC